MCGAYRGRRLGRHCHAAGGGRTTTTQQQQEKRGRARPWLNSQGAHKPRDILSGAGSRERFHHLTHQTCGKPASHHTGQEMDSVWRICEKCLQPEACICLMRHLCYYASLGFSAPNLDQIPGRNVLAKSCSRSECRKRRAGRERNDTGRARSVFSYGSRHHCHGSCRQYSVQEGR